MSFRLGERDRGAVLIAVLALGALAAAIAMEMAYQSRVEATRVNFDQSWNQADLIARDGVLLAERLIDREARLPAGSGILKGNPVAVSLSSGVLEIRITEESGRFPLHKLLDAEGLLDLDKKRMLSRFVFVLSGAEQEVDRIVDYVDSDDEPFPQGAESFEYGTLNPPRRPANRPFLSAGEVAKVYSMDENPKLLEQMIPAVTLWGDGVVNINAAPPAVIASLSTAISIITAQKIAERAKTRQFSSMEDLHSFAEVPVEFRDEINRRAGTSGGLYRIETKGVVGSVEVRLTSILEKGPAGLRVVHAEPGWKSAIESDEETDE